MARRGPTALIAVAAAVLASATPPVRAAPLPASSAPLPGSTFQGADGNQDDQAPYVDWQALQGAGRVVHSPDPNAADSVFSGASKEDAPGDWALTTEAGGATPGKANILDAWSAVDQPSAKTFLYLGFTREAANGTTYVAFELNQDTRLWDNGRARIPCRRTGDVLASVAAHGNAVDLVLERWTTTATDAASGCATRGRLTQVAAIADGDAQGAVNAGTIISRLPGADAPGTPIADGRFGETALDLGALLDAAFGDSCLALGSVWMHSRSSDSESSSMQDYVAPYALTVRTCAAAGT